MSNETKGAIMNVIVYLEVRLKMDDSTLVDARTSAIGHTDLTTASKRELMVYVDLLIKSLEA